MMDFFVWITLLAAVYLGMFLLVPLNKIRDYFSFGLYFGVFLGLLILFAGTTVLKLWKIENTIINVAGFELTIALDWFPPVIIFCYYIRRFSHNWLSLTVYILTFALAATIAKEGLSYLGYWVDIRWNGVLTFLLAIAAHLILVTYLLLRGHLPRPGKII